MEQQKQKCAATSAESKSTEKRKITVGSVWESKFHGAFEVIAYGGYLDVTIRFNDTGFEAKVRSSNVSSGEVKDKMSPNVCGVGFIGDGVHGGDSMYYRTWRSMMQRCYDPYVINKNPTYKDCYVCEEWHNFQNFADWCHKNHPDVAGTYQLDKDIKVIGNKTYSPENCMFVTKIVNGFLVDSGAQRGNCMIGVCFDKARCNFQSYCNNPFTKKREYLGRHNSEIEAHLAWRKRKSELAYELAMIQDREEVKQALLNWKFALDNFEIHKMDTGNYYELFS